MFVASLRASKPLPDNCLCSHLIPWFFIPACLLTRRPSPYPPGFPCLWGRCYATSPPCVCMYDHYATGHTCRMLMGMWQGQSNSNEDNFHNSYVLCVCVCVVYNRGLAVSDSYIKAKSMFDQFFFYLYACHKILLEQTVITHTPHRWGEIRK